MSHAETQLLGFIAWQWDRYFLLRNVFLVVVVVVVVIIIIHKVVNNPSL